MNAVKEELKLALEILSDAKLMYKEKRLKSAVNRRRLRNRNIR